MNSEDSRRREHEREPSHTWPSLTTYHNSMHNR